MDNNLIVAVITGCISAFGSIATVLITNSKNNALQDERIGYIKNEIQQLSNHVEQHNNFGLQLTELKTRVEILEKK